MSFVLLFSLFHLFLLCWGQDFGYEGDDGPKYWGDKYQQCVGKHQSPININTHKVHVVDLPALSFRNFDVVPNSANVTNNGHTVVVTLDTNKIPTITGGPLIEEYQFVQFHFHWGSNDSMGSENTINNNSYPVELHMVFFQVSYGSYAEAINHPDGLTVLSFLFSKSTHNQNYSPVIDVLSKIRHENTSTSINDLPSLDRLTAKNRCTYFTYSGSLTTPPCSESVTWIEFKETIPLSDQQIEMFRQLYGTDGRMLHNFRPTQPLNGRVIRLNRCGNSGILLRKNAGEKSSAFKNGFAVSLVLTCVLLLFSL